MAETNPVRVAAIGLGWVTTHRHIPALRRSTSGRLIGVIDYQPGRAESTAHALNLGFWATANNAADVRWLDQVEAVTIGTPPLTHYGLVRSYLEAGKHVLVEKPMAMTIEQARELSELAVKYDRVLAVVHNFQFSRSVHGAIQVLKSGRLGELRSIWAVQMSNPKRRLPSWYEQLPLGLFYDESPHFFYLLRALAPANPEFRFISVVPNREGANTPVKITALLDSHGTPIQLDMNFEAPLSEWHIALLGTQRAAFVDIFRDILLVVPNDSEHLGRNILRTSLAVGWSHLLGTIGSGARVVTGRLDYGNNEVFHRFLMACRGNSEALVGISASDGVAVVAMQHRVIEASK